MKVWIHFRFRQWHVQVDSWHGLTITDRWGRPDPDWPLVEVFQWFSYSRKLRRLK